MDRNIRYASFDSRLAPLIIHFKRSEIVPCKHIINGDTLAGVRFR